MNTIDADIKSKQLKNFYLLYGEEDYLKNRYSTLIAKAAPIEDEDMNLTRFDEKNLDAAKLIDMAYTMPFFADKRIIIIKNSGYFKTANEEFNKYLEEPADTCILVFVESEVDKRNKAYKTFDKLGVTQELNSPSQKDIQTWIGNKLKSDSKQMQRAAFEEFTLRTDSNMENMSREYEKLISYVGNRETITKEDVENICTKQLQYNVFLMINEIAKKNTKEVLSIYHDILASKASPFSILGAITTQFRRYINIKSLREEGLTNAQISSELGIKQFIVDNGLRIIKDFPSETMQCLLNDSCELEERIKKGLINDQIAVELLIIKYSK